VRPFLRLPRGRDGETPAGARQDEVKRARATERRGEACVI
jgi:hypothetical protein